ncbi:glycosyltransferase [Agromyces soli]|uniref:D-inositol 3-phosphate glycosyltransferase n=1 Tax=Agromyces soli TaxID=659012 RepID=A0ABY4AW19_9MICO|nr:glycosyltransferase [Agromyces soli]UOE26043.1 glycosyltransferase [Agromyces soli]
MPRVAIAKNTLQVPPTYFAVAHAMRLREEFDFELFTMAADVQDPAVRLPLDEAVPFRSAPLRTREYLIPLFLARMSRRIRRFRPDLIHQHFATWSWPASRAAAKDDVPMLTTIHGADVVAAGATGGGLLGAWNRRNAELAAARSRRVLAVSEYLADSAVRAGFPADRLEVHYQGIDTDFFTPEPSVGLRTDAPPTIVFVGAISTQKGVDQLVEASIEVQRTVPHRLELIGSGPLLAPLQESAPAHIAFLGRQDREAVRARLRAASLLVLPTVTTEAAGLVLLEAQACGTPVIAYRSGGTSEMLDDGSTGQLIEPGNVRALEAAIRAQLALPSAEAERMRRRAREFVVQQRSLEVSARQLAEHYRSLIG